MLTYFTPVGTTVRHIAGERWRLRRARPPQHDDAREWVAFPRTRAAHLDARAEWWLLALGPDIQDLTRSEDGVLRFRTRLQGAHLQASAALADVAVLEAPDTPTTGLSTRTAFARPAAGWDRMFQDLRDRYGRVLTRVPTWSSVMPGSMEANAVPVAFVDHGFVDANAADFWSSAPQVKTLPLGISPTTWLERGVGCLLSNPSLTDLEEKQYLAIHATFAASLLIGASFRRKSKSYGGYAEWALARLYSVSVGATRDCSMPFHNTFSRIINQQGELQRDDSRGQLSGVLFGSSDQDLLRDAPIYDVDLEAWVQLSAAPLLYDARASGSEDAMSSQGDQLEVLTGLPVVWSAGNNAQGAIAAGLNVVAVGSVDTATPDPQSRIRPTAPNAYQLSSFSPITKLKYLSRSEANPAALVERMYGKPEVVAPGRWVRGVVPMGYKTRAYKTFGDERPPDLDRPWTAARYVADGTSFASPAGAAAIAWIQSRLGRMSRADRPSGERSPDTSAAQVRAILFAACSSYPSIVAERGGIPASDRRTCVFGQIDFAGVQRVFDLGHTKVERPIRIKTRRVRIRRVASNGPLSWFRPETEFTVIYRVIVPVVKREPNRVVVTWRAFPQFEPVEVEYVGSPRVTHVVRCTAPYVVLRCGSLTYDSMTGAPYRAFDLTPDADVAALDFYAPLDAHSPEPELPQEIGVATCPHIDRRADGGPIAGWMEGGYWFRPEEPGGPFIHTWSNVPASRSGLTRIDEDRDATPRGHQ